jgi:hypothetical protein
MPKTRTYVIIDHAGRLHVRINYGATNKFEAALLEVF